MRGAVIRKSARWRKFHNRLDVVPYPVIYFISSLTKQSYMKFDMKHIGLLVVAAALVATPVMNSAFAEAPKARAIQNGVSLDESTEGDLLSDIDCVGGIDVSENTDHTICYLIPDGVPTPDYKTDASVVSQEGSGPIACPAVGGFGAGQECFSTTFDIGLFNPVGHFRFLIEFYDAQGNIIDIQGSNNWRNHSFFVLPESPIGILALVGSSLAVLGGFMFLRSRNHSNLPI